MLLDADTSPELLPGYDYVVVGGGAAGCVLVRRLVESTDARILLIEAGPADTGIADIDEAARWTALLRSPFDWGYDYLPTAHVAGRAVGIPRGRVLGGSSSINAMMWYRGHPSDYDAWEAAGATGWNWSTLLPYFKRVEDWAGGADEFRGAGGPMRVEVSRDPHPLALAMLEGAPEIGVPVIADPNGASNEGATLANLNATTLPDGRMMRWSTTRGYLRPVLDHPRVTVLTGSAALRVVVEEGRAVGIEHLVAGSPRTTRADTGVVLTLGAIDTPKLLLLSGIGAAEHVSQVGIPVTVDLPGVGDGYQDHPLVSGMNFSASEPLGPLRDNGGGSMINWRSSLAGGKPDLHTFLVQESRPAPDVDPDADLSGNIFAMSPGLMGSRSTGHVRLRSADPAVAPEIDAGFLREPEDIAALLEAVDDILELAETSPFRALGARPLNAAAGRTRQEKVEFVRRGVDTFFHSAGSVRMGDDEAAPVTPELRVRGIDGLWVADASVMPKLPTSNTQWPTLAIAERAADFIAPAAR